MTDHKAAAASGRAAAAPFKRALVTGASSGIGRAIARQLVAGGAQVAMVARRADVLADQAGEWRQAGLPGLAVPMAADLADPEAAARVARAAQADLGPFDLVVNSAGIYLTGDVDAVPLQQYMMMMNVNFLSAVATVQAVLPALKQARRGAIINVSSLAGKIPAPHISGYGATKAAMATFTASLRHEVGSLGIHVVGVYPGPVETPMIRDRAGKGPAYRVKLMPILTAEHVARAALAAAARGSAELVMPAAAALSARLHGAFPGLSSAVTGLLFVEL